jgi:hypothetical protein
MTITGTALTAGTYYGTVAGVEAHVPTIGTISALTKPTTTQVVAWLEEATAIIDRTLATAGYTTPVASTSTNYSELVGLANLYGAARTLQARAIEAATGEIQPRWQAMLDEFYARLIAIANSTLTGISAAASTTGGTARRIRGIQTVRVDRQVDTASEYT